MGDGGRLRHLYRWRWRKHVYWLLHGDLVACKGDNALLGGHRGNVLISSIINVLTISVTATHEVSMG